MKFCFGVVFYIGKFSKVNLTCRDRVLLERVGVGVCSTTQHHTGRRRHCLPDFGEKKSSPLLRAWDGKSGKDKFHQVGLREANGYRIEPSGNAGSASCLAWCHSEQNRNQPNGVLPNKGR